MSKQSQLMKKDNESSDNEESMDSLNENMMIKGCLPPMSNAPI